MFFHVVFPCMRRFIGKNTQVKAKERSPDFWWFMGEVVQMARKILPRKGTYGTRKLVVWVDVSPFPFGDIFIFWGMAHEFCFPTPPFLTTPKHLSSFGGWQHTQQNGGGRYPRQPPSSPTSWYSRWNLAINEGNGHQTSRKLQHTPISHTPHPIPPVSPSMKGIPAYSPFNVKVAQGCVPVRCVETTFRQNRLMQEGEQLEVVGISRSFEQRVGKPLRIYFFQTEYSPGN